MLINKVSDDACQWICHDVVISIGGIFLKNALYEETLNGPQWGGNLNNNFQKSQMPGGLPGGMLKLRIDPYITQ